MRHKRVQTWDDERRMGNSLIVGLVPGFKFSDDPMACEHVRGFDTVRDAITEVVSAIPCNCSQCSQLEKS